MAEHSLPVGASPSWGWGKAHLQRAPGCAITYVDAADPLIISSGFLYLVFDVIECSAKLL